MKAIQSWTRSEEKALVRYVKMHRDRQNLVNWNQISDYLPQKTMSQITSKYFRMKNDLTQRWNFDIDGQHTSAKMGFLERPGYDMLLEQLICLIG